MILVCGEALIDLVPTGPDGAYAARPGGSPANVAVGLGRLGRPAALLCRLSGDAFGRRLADHVEASGVDTSFVLRSAEPTTLAVVTLDAQGRAEYAFYVDGAADGGWDAADLPAALPGGAALHVAGSLALGVPSMGDTVEALLTRERGRRVLALDPNVRPALARDEADLRARLDRWLGLVDLVKVSEDDLAWLYPGEPVAQAADRWRAAGPSVVVVTRGGDGVHAAGPSGALDLPGAPSTSLTPSAPATRSCPACSARCDEDGDLTREGLAELGDGRPACRAGLRAGPSPPRPAAASGPTRRGARSCRSARHVTRRPREDTVAVHDRAGTTRAAAGPRRRRPPGHRVLHRPPRPGGPGPAGRVRHLGPPRVLAADGLQRRPHRRDQPGYRRPPPGRRHRRPAAARQGHPRAVGARLGDRAGGVRRERRDRAGRQPRPLHARRRRCRTPC